MTNFFRTSPSNQQKVFIVHKDERTPVEKIAGNADLQTIRFKLVRPEGSKINSNFKEFILAIKDAGRSNLSVEDIAELMAKPDETEAELKYIIAHKRNGTEMGFAINGKIETVLIPKGLGIDCLMEVYTSDTENVDCYVDATNSRIFTPDDSRWGHH